MFRKTNVCRIAWLASNAPSWYGVTLTIPAGLPSQSLLGEPDSGPAHNVVMSLRQAVCFPVSLPHGLKNDRMSAASISGSSKAAKCPPVDISVQRWTLKNRSAHSRGGCEISAGKRANAAGVASDPIQPLTVSIDQRAAPAFMK